MLQDEIKQIQEDLEAGHLLNEESVKLGIVLRLLSALGWPIYDAGAITPAYDLAGRQVDFALCHPPRKLHVLIDVKLEVKQEGGNPGEEHQLLENASRKSVPLTILTDGQEWNFFLTGESADYRERRVYKLDLVEREIGESAERLRRYLGYEAVCDGSAIAAANADYRDVEQNREIQAALPKAWRRLVEEEDDLLIELLVDHVESVCGYKPKLDLVAEFLPKLIVREEPMRSREVTSVTSGGEAASDGPWFQLGGPPVTCRNATEVLVSVFEELVKRDADFPKRFASLPKHGRKRRYLAADRYELYPGRPDFAAQYSHKLQCGWWLGTHTGRMGIKRIVQMACRVAGLRFGHDLVIQLNSGGETR